jgi:hypothetical protein
MAKAEANNAMTPSAEIRQHLVDALRIDLIGPSWDDVARRYEQINQPPSVRYTTPVLLPGLVLAGARALLLAGAPGQIEGLQQLQGHCGVHGTHLKAPGWRLALHTSPPV